MNTALVIPVGAGRVENLTQVLKSVTEMSMTPKVLVLVCDGEDAWIDEGFDAFKDLNFRLVCNRYGILPVVFNSAKHEPGMEQPRNIGVRLAERTATAANIKLSHVWFLDSDCIVSKGALAAFERANLAAGPELVDKRILIGPYDWLAQGYRQEPPVICDELGLLDMLREKEYPNEADALSRGAQIDQIAEHLGSVPGADRTAIVCLLDAAVMFDQLEFRAASFKEHPPEKTLTEDLSAGLACFSGNLIWPIEEFKRVGGFWDELHHGRCEDGELGIRAVHMGIPIGFAPDAKAFHLWHERNPSWAMRANSIDVPKLNERHPWMEGRCVCGRTKEEHRCLTPPTPMRPCHGFVAEEGQPEVCEACGAGLWHHGNLTAECDSFKPAVFMVDEDGKRFNVRCECGWEGNTLLMWGHRRECPRDRVPGG